MRRPLFFNSALSISISGLGGACRNRLSLAATLDEFEEEGRAAETGFKPARTLRPAGTTATWADICPRSGTSTRGRVPDGGQGEGLKGHLHSRKSSSWMGKSRALR